MNPFQFKATCSVCGGPGACTSKTLGAMFYSEVVHSDPRICSDYLADERDRLARAAKALQESQKPEPVDSRLADDPFT